jgi:hypothetical protein
MEFAIASRSDATVEADQNKVTSDLTDLSDTISSNNTLFNPTTDEQNHSTSEVSETMIKTNSYIVTPSQSDSSDISDMSDTSVAANFEP